MNNCYISTHNLSCVCLRRLSVPCRATVVDIGSAPSRAANVSAKSSAAVNQREPILARLRNFVSTAATGSDYFPCNVVVWRYGNGVDRINEITSGSVNTEMGDRVEGKQCCYHSMHNENSNPTAAVNAGETRDRHSAISRSTHVAAAMFSFSHCARRPL